MKTACCFLIILIILTGFIMFYKREEYYPSKGAQLVNSILGKSAVIIRDKYNIKPCGVGVAMPGGPIQEVTLCFDTKYPYTKEQLRELLIKSAQELLGQVNQNQEIQEFIKDQPFTIEHVQIIIYNHDKSGREVFDPEISTADISQGVLTYQTVDAEDTFTYKQEFTESYEEALKALSTH